MTGFYLSLNQGITFFEKEYGKNRYINATLVADYFRTQIDETSFSKNEIDITCGDKSKSLGYGYQKTNIISKYYPIDKLDEKMLVRDLMDLYLYRDNLEHLKEVYLII